MANLFESLPNNNPEYEKRATAFKSMDPKIFRVFAFDFRLGHMINGYTPNISVTAEGNNLINDISLQNIVDMAMQSLPQTYKSTKILSSKMTTSGSDIPIGIIETSVLITTSTGSKLPAYEQLVIFKMPDVAVTITIAVPTTVQAKMLPEFKEVIDSIKKLDQ